MFGRSLLLKTSGRLLLYPNYVQDHLDRVTAADVSAGNTQGLDLGVTDAFNTTLQAMVGDGSLGVSNNVLAQAASLIKASCFMQGARTLSGALVPLAADMPAPTNFNFVAGDYDRRTGLVGNGSTKHLNGNYAISSTLSSNTHVSVFVSAVPTIASSLIEAFVLNGSVTGIYRDTSSASSFYSCWTSSNYSGPSLSNGTLAGVSRDNGTTMVVRSNNTSQTLSRAVAATLPASHTPFIFARNSNGNPALRTNARLAFYSMGEFIDLAILDARIAALSTAIQSAIPA